MLRINIWFFIAVLLFVAFLVLNLLTAFLVPLVMSLIVVSIFLPLHLFIKHKINNKEKLAALLTTFIVFLLVVTPISIFIIALIQESFYLINIYNSAGDVAISLKIKDVIQTVQDYLANFEINIPKEKITSIIFSAIKKISNIFYNNISLLATNLTNLAFNSFITLVLILTFFIHGKTLKNYIIDLLPLPKDEQERLIVRFKELSFAIFAGNTLISFLEGTICGILIYFFNIEGAIIWGSLIAVLSFLPLIGGGIVILGLSIYLFSTGSHVSAMVFFFLNIIQIFILENLVKTKVIGDKSHMHEILVFLSIMAGVQVYGMLGFFYGPLIMTMFLSLASIYKEHYVKFLK
jgi:predicted PurR-regulated permease PerM